MTSPDSTESLFDSAQEKYYGEESFLISNKKNPLDDEIIYVRQKHIKSILSNQKDILEVGPGSGALSNWLSNQGYNVTCVEHSPFLASNISNSINATVITGEFEKLNINKCSIDLFLSFHVIEHVLDPQAHLRKAYDVVRSGGYALIATPNAGSWQQRLFTIVSPNFDSAHLRVFSSSSLLRLSEEAGWKVIRVVTPEHTIYWIRLLTKMLRRIKNEDEELTAGKYSGQSSGLIKVLLRLAQVVTYPLRVLQRYLGGGNELFFILKKSG